MRNLSLRMFIVLTTISVISGFSLSYVWKLSYNKIIYQKEKQIKDGLKMVFNRADRFEKEEKGEFFYYRIFKGENFLGYGIIAKGNGYQGEIVIAVGISSDLKNVIGIKVLENVETPGLGNRIAEENFTEQFRRKVFPLSLEGEEKHLIHAISGATISSRSVVKIVNKSIEELRNILRG